MESWREIVSDEPIIYSESELLTLRETNKLRWRSKLKELTDSPEFQKQWLKYPSNASSFTVTHFQPHHAKEVLDLVSYQFSSFGNNNFHKILNTPVGALKTGCKQCIDHVCLTGLSYIVLDKYAHVCGVFYGWDERDAPPFDHSTHHVNSIKEDEVIAAAIENDPFSKNLLLRNRKHFKYGDVYFGEILAVRPDLMNNGWFAKLSFIIALLFGMDYSVYYDFDFQPKRHLYNIEAFRNIPMVRSGILRYELFGFKDFVFKCDRSNINDNFEILKDQYKFKDVEYLKKNAFIGCFVLRNSSYLKKTFKTTGFIGLYQGIQTMLYQQYMFEQKFKKKKKLRAKL